jgi:hypothetical protein
MSTQPIDIPASDFMDVADVLRRILDKGSVMGGLHVRVEPGAATIMDEGGTYGTRVWKKAEGS